MKPTPVFPAAKRLLGDNPFVKSRAHMGEGSFAVNIFEVLLQMLAIFAKIALIGAGLLTLLIFISIAYLCCYDLPPMAAAKNKMRRPEELAAARGQWRGRSAHRHRSRHAPSR